MKSIRRIDVEQQRAKNTLESVPDNLMEMCVMPRNLNEILVDETQFLQENVVHGRYESLNHYLDVQFRLLREDFMHPLREGINCFREMVKHLRQEPNWETNNNSSKENNNLPAKKRLDIDSLHVYDNVTIESSFLSDNGK